MAIFLGLTDFKRSTWLFFASEIKHQIWWTASFLWHSRFTDRLLADRMKHSPEILHFEFCGKYFGKGSAMVFVCGLPAVRAQSKYALYKKALTNHITVTDKEISLKYNKIIILVWKSSIALKKTCIKMVLKYRVGRGGWRVGDLWLILFCGGGYLVYKHGGYLESSQIISNLVW